MNLLVEDWGGKIQSHDISAKVGTGVKELLEKVLLEAEILDLKANPNKAASGTVVEAFLDKGKDMFLQFSSKRNIKSWRLYVSRKTSW
jgi:translation initiation factor IF-2